MTFLWGSKYIIKRTKVIQELKHGGLNMIDVKYMFISFKAVCFCTVLFHKKFRIYAWYSDKKRSLNFAIFIYRDLLDAD